MALARVLDAPEVGVTASVQSAGMVLVAPTLSRPDTAGREATGRDEVLALLRDGGDQRPTFDPGLAGGLRAWLEDAAWVVVSARGEDATPLFLGPRQLLGGDAGPRTEERISGALVMACLVHALFRQLVTTGSVGDPLRDGLGALGVDPGRSEVVRWVAALPAAERTALRSSLANQVTHLRDLTPRFAGAWLPRTNDRVAIPLAGGRVVLHGVFDLLVGAPMTGAASLCAVGLTTGGPWERARRSLHYLALLETLRSGTPPFRLALLQSATGRYGVEDVLEEHLRAMVSHVATRLIEVAVDHG
jgi:hypothetical protein